MNYNDDMGFNPIIIRNVLLDNLKQGIKCSDISWYAVGNGEYIINVSNDNKLMINIIDDEVIVMYHNECRHYYAYDYMTVADLADEVTEFVFDIFYNPIKIEYCYKANKLMGRRVYLMNINKLKKERIDSTIGILKWLLMFGNKRIESEIITFS